MASSSYSYQSQYIRQYSQSCGSNQPPLLITRPLESPCEDHPHSFSMTDMQGNGFHTLQRQGFPQARQSYSQSPTRANDWYSSRATAAFGREGTSAKGRETLGGDRYWQTSHNRANYDTLAPGQLTHTSKLDSIAGNEQARVDGMGYSNYDSAPPEQAEITQPQCSLAQPSSYISSVQSRQSQLQMHSTRANFITPGHSIVPASHITTNESHDESHYQNLLLASSKQNLRSIPLQKITQSDRPQHMSDRTISLSPAAMVKRSPVPSIGHTHGDIADDRVNTIGLMMDDKPPLTVNPRQIYDHYHEYQRAEAQCPKAAAKRVRASQKAAEVKAAEVKAAEVKAAEVKEAEVKAAEVKAAEVKAAEIVKSAEEARRLVGAAQVKQSDKTTKRQRLQQSDSDIEPHRRARKGAPWLDSPAQAAAMTLMQTANSTPKVDNNQTLEARMRAMFKKMRELNAEDPALLSKLWQQEREEHLASQTQPKSVTPRLAPVVSVASALASSAAPKETPMPSPPSPKTNSSTMFQECSAVTNKNGLSKDASQPSGTVWPSDKKTVLAAAAVDLLCAMPDNHGKEINASEISSMLDTNPSYEQLCEQIENRGIRLDKSQFAKALLAAVPEVKRPAPHPSPAGVISVGGSLPMVVGRPVKEQSLVDNPTRSKGSLLPNHAIAPARKVQIDALSGTSTVQDNPRSSTETTGNASIPIISVENAHPGGIDDCYDIPTIDSRLEGLDAVKNFVKSTATRGSLAHAAARQMKSAVRYHFSGAKRPFVAITPASKVEAARKRTFGDLVDLTLEHSDDENPNFLCGSAESGTLPYMSTPTHIQVSPVAAVGTGNNWASSMTETKHTEVDLDRNTGQALVNVRHQSHLFDYTAEKSSLVRQLDKYKAIRRSTYNPRTIARDVLLACGRHPDMRHLNAHLDLLKLGFKQVDNMADLSTFRWDIVDPGGPPPGSGNPVPPGPSEIQDDADDEGDDSSLPDSLGLTGQVDGLEAESNTKNSSRGRHGSRTMTSTVDLIQSDAVSCGDASTTPRAQPSGYSALRAAQAAHSGQAPAKKRGRPVGWRKWMMKDGGFSSSKPSTPAKQPSNVAPEPEYRVYKCEWKDCSAELHNLQTLRKHLHKLHQRRAADGVFHCLWRNCGKIVTQRDPTTSRTISNVVPRDFTTEDAWTMHVEKQHVKPIAWELGDGPAGGVSEAEQSEAYLSDGQGRRVTPSVIISVPENRNQKIGSTKKTTEEKALEVQRALATKRAQIGPGVDRGGARLANEKRRQGFVGDDDAVEIIEGTNDRQVR